MESNAQKIMGAARHLLCVIDEMGLKPWRADDPLAIACDKLDAALALPLLNCNVGTPDEQRLRYYAFCDQRECEHCELTRIGCQFAWEQMPYEGEAK